MIGPCEFDPPVDAEPWLDDIGEPIILVTTSSDRQADENLVRVAIEALADEPVHVVATFPCGVPHGLALPANATVTEFIPHGRVLDRAVCAITHGGMGITQKALARGVPVCVVPHGRDQFEVARRVEVSGWWNPLTCQEVDPEAAENQDAAGDVDDPGELIGWPRALPPRADLDHGADLVERRLLAR